MISVGVLFSGGKDSNYALHWAVLHGFHVSCLITVKPRSRESWMFHYPAIELTRLQSEALGIPHILVEGTGRDEEDLLEAMRRASEEFGIEGVVSGALLSDYQRTRISMAAEELGLRSYTPLWRKNQESYMRSLVLDGFKFILVSVSAEGLGPQHLGRPVEGGLLEDVLERARRYGFNPALEGGEAETLVLRAPLYRGEIKVKGEAVRTGPMSWVYRITSAWMEE